MAFITKQRLAELEHKERQCNFYQNQCRELSLELKLRKQNEHNRERMIGFNESMEIQKDPATGQEIREHKKVTRTLIQPVGESLKNYLENSPFIAK
ncbi:hypothetical protein [Lactococcus garvieae]|uniref:hypothetical protein n=1 Tax=Lactococcus garvieae TaxID=1363 RepID=UPI00288D5BAF|nr:hypothetical protein [Lactococcus garvieae]MDT2741992.1 hypothetical protein [Lactococcus garvieae]